MKMSSKIHKGFIQLLLDNYFILIFIGIILLVGLIVIAKSLTAKDEIVYAKVKISQGYWWASTVRPSLWMAKSFKKGDSETNLSGKKIAEITEVRYYPVVGLTSATEQNYDVYITVKLLAKYNNKTKKYSFKRSPLLVGTPIDFDFTEVQSSGTVLNLSKRPPKETYISKTLTLKKMFTNMWEYDAIQVGDSYFDGTEKIFEVLNKSYQMAYAEYNSSAIQSEPPINVIVTVRLKLPKSDSELVYRDTPIQIGRRMYLQSSKFLFDQYFITDIK